MSEAALPSPVTVSALLILVTVFHGLGVTATWFRLWFQYRVRRLWWDDFWAALTLVCDVVGTVTTWTSFAPLNDPYSNYEALPTPALSRNAHIISVWLVTIFYTCAIWSARMSIICSIVRVVPPSRAIRTAVISACGMFFCMWIYILTCKSVMCASNTSWYYDSDFVHCSLPEWVAVSEVATDALSDLVLVVFPLRLLWRVKLPSNQKRTILSVFSASILVSIISAVHTAYIIPEFTLIGGLTAEMESAVSLIVCNLFVIVTYVYRVVRHGGDLTAGLSDRRDRLTTIDLDYPGVSWFSHSVTETGFASTALTGASFVAEGKSDHAAVSDVSVVLDADKS